MPRDQLSSAQIRAARALIGLSTKELAELSGVGWATIRRFEQTDGVPPSRAGTLKRLKECLEEVGVEFLGDPETSPGVQLKPRRR
jgi:predicted transcriptional regulator